MVSDRYEHHFHEHTAKQHDNLLMLARYLVIDAERLEAEGGLLFDPAYMMDFTPMPDGIGDRPHAAIPPLAHGPLAGIAALPGEDWQEYCERAFGICIFLPDPFCLWLQSPLWAKTEPSAKGAGLRIAYVLDCGVPGDYIEIAMGQAHTDYDRSGFLWDKLDLPAELFRQGIRTPIREWPECIRARAQREPCRHRTQCGQSAPHSDRTRHRAARGHCGLERRRNTPTRIHYRPVAAQLS
jgi:hypothetical protein